jgi:uncharacterized protein YabN with tetrapyrrole methylase and pyrophosphatase domain
VKFERRFARVIELAKEHGLKLGDATLQQLDAIWEEIKNTERGEAGEE